MAHCDAAIWSSAKLSYASYTRIERANSRRVGLGSLPSRRYHETYYLFRAQWGFHPGGWGKPPLDEYNRPLYGDVFGVLPKPIDPSVSEFG